MWTLSGPRTEMLSAIEAHRASHEVFVKTKPSKRIFLALLERTAVKKIIVSQGIAATMPSRVFDGLRSAGVEIEIREARAGRPDKFDTSLRKKLLSAVASGATLRDALKKFGVSRRSYFYWKKKSA